MKNKLTLVKWAALLALLSTINAQLSNVLAQGTAFTYQGRLNSGGNPANGSYDLTFALFNTNASGVAIAGPVTNSATSVSNGLFTTLVDFGNAFNGGSNWLELAVSTNGANNFITLAPRQQITPAPYAITAENVSGTISSADLSSIGNNNGGSENFFIGLAGNATTTGSWNTANGVAALVNDTTGYYNTANGFAALNDNMTGYNNTANGVATLNANTSGHDNTANGYEALYHNQTGDANTANGSDALYDNTTGFDNTANGVDALKYNTTGSYNTANGTGALYDNKTGSYNTANGVDALEYNTTGYDNTANGYEALYSNTNGYYNTANGAFALYSNTAGSGNAANGNSALYSNTSGDDNTANGGFALFSNMTGNNNIALGEGAAYYITTGNNNIEIGNEGFSSDNNIIRIGTPGTQTATYLAGDVAIGASSPVAQLDVEGSDDSGNFLLPIALVRNNDKGSAAAPSLTVAGMGNTGNGVLCVTTSGTGLLARFGNGSAWVADIKTNGTIDAASFNNSSDRNMKENFSAVSAKTVLEKVVSLPISQWNFKQNVGINHIGPMAQDFYAAFNVGSDDKHIATVDEDGVALAAIQGLNQKLQEQLKQQNTENAELKQQNNSLAQRLSALEQTVESLAEKK